MTTSEVSFYYDWGKISINRFLTSKILNTTIIRPHFCTYQSKLQPVHTRGFAFEQNPKKPKKTLKSQIPTVTQNDIWGTNNWILILFATAQYDREGLLITFFLSEYNGKRNPDMNPNQTAQGSFLFNIKIIWSKILWRRSRSQNWSKTLQSTNYGLCMESWP